LNTHSGPTTFASSASAASKSASLIPGGVAICSFPLGTVWSADGFRSYKRAFGTTSARRQAPSGPDNLELAIVFRREQTVGWQRAVSASRRTESSDDHEPRIRHERARDRGRHLPDQYARRAARRREVQLQSIPRAGRRAAAVS